MLPAQPVRKNSIQFAKEVAEVPLDLVTRLGKFVSRTMLDMMLDANSGGIGLALTYPDRHELYYLVLFYYILFFLANGIVIWQLTMSGLASPYLSLGSSDGVTQVCQDVSSASLVAARTVSTGNGAPPSPPSHLTASPNLEAQVPKTSVVGTFQGDVFGRWETDAKFKSNSSAFVLEFQGSTIGNTDYQNTMKTFRTKLKALSAKSSNRDAGWNAVMWSAFVLYDPDARMSFYSSGAKRLRSWVLLLPLPPLPTAHRKTSPPIPDPFPTRTSQRTPPSFMMA